MSTSPTSAAQIKRMPRERLSEMLLSHPPHSTGASTSSTFVSPFTPFAIIDVRGDDHVGGNIRTSLHYPSNTLDYTMPELVRKLAEKDLVVFHCALSQERGPKAARKYLEERARMRGNGSGSQEVYVLDRGFVGWQEL